MEENPDRPSRIDRQGSHPNQVMTKMTEPDSVEAVINMLALGGYYCDDDLAMGVFLSMKLGKPLFLEGEPGVGKTEMAKVLSDRLGRRLIRLHCYEGLDVSTAVYEWNYAKQLLSLKLAGEAGASQEHLEDVFSPEFLLSRPLLDAIRSEAQGQRAVLLIDELDRANEEFEAFLLELLSDFQVTIPEMGTVGSKTIPLVILTSNRTREIHDAIIRRCLSFRYQPICQGMSQALPHLDYFLPFYNLKTLEDFCRRLEGAEDLARWGGGQIWAETLMVKETGMEF